MIAGNANLALNSLLPALTGLRNRPGVIGRLAQQGALIAYHAQRGSGVAQGRPGLMNVDQAWLAREPSLHCANDLAGGISARRLLAEFFPRGDQLVEQGDRLNALWIAQPPFREAPPNQKQSCQ
jgi:hypothetical protein